MTGGAGKIVFGSDFSEVSERALGEVIDFARALGAEVDVVHVYSLSAFNLPIEGAVMPSAPQLSRLTTDLQQQLGELIARHANAGVKLQGHLRAGNAPEELVRFADEVQARMVAVGTHGRRGPAHAFLGSVAERVMRHANRPVLIVRPH